MLSFVILWVGTGTGKPMSCPPKCADEDKSEVFECSHHEWQHEQFALVAHFTGIMEAPGSQGTKSLLNYMCIRVFM